MTGEHHLPTTGEHLRLRMIGEHLLVPTSFYRITYTHGPQRMIGVLPTTLEAATTSEVVMTLEATTLEVMTLAEVMTLEALILV